MANDMQHYPALAEYRRTVAESFARVRANPNPAQAVTQWRQERDSLFKNHPLSPIEAQDQPTFAGVPYVDYDLAWRMIVPISYEGVATVTYSLDLPEGVFQYKRFAKVDFTAPTGKAGTLYLYWVVGYGGGVFLPFGDTTNKHTTYGAGRYLYDTIKGADLGITATEMVLDFNFAYHPSCTYSPRWTCPLAPPENRLPFAVPVGEILL
jgi:uncharacterized protein